MHCSDPPCLEVCPTGATCQRSDGIIHIKNERCIGCGACILACPYNARSIVFEDVIARSEMDLKKKTPPSMPIGLVFVRNAISAYPVWKRV